VVNFVPFVKEVATRNCAFKLSANGDENTAAYREDLLVVDVDFDPFDCHDFETQMLHCPVFSPAVHRGLDLKDVRDDPLAGALPHITAA